MNKKLKLIKVKNKISASSDDCQKTIVIISMNVCL